MSSKPYEAVLKSASDTLNDLSELKVRIEKLSEGSDIVNKKSLLDSVESDMKGIEKAKKTIDNPKSSATEKNNAKQDIQNIIRQIEKTKARIEQIENPTNSP